MARGNFWIEHSGEDGAPLVYNEDRRSAVPIRGGRKAYKAACQIKDSLDRIGADYAFGGDVLYAPYKILFSYNPMPMYRGLDKEGTDRVRIPCYMSGKRVVKHEGSHMAHRRLLESRLEGSDAKIRSEDMLRNIWKSDFAMTERFANKYSGMEGAYAGMAAGSFGASVTGALLVGSKMVDSVINGTADPQNIIVGVSALALILYLGQSSSRLLRSYFRPIDEVTEI